MWWFSQPVPRTQGAGAAVTSRKGKEKGKAGLGVGAADSGAGRGNEPRSPGSVGPEGGRGPRVGRQEDARRGQERGEGTCQGRRVQWEERASRTSTCLTTSRRRGGRQANGRPSRAGAGPGGIGAGAPGDSWRSRVATAGRGKRERAAGDATATSRMVPSHP